MLFLLIMPRGSCDNFLVAVRRPRRGEYVDTRGEMNLD